jgi:hypothetical protein
MLGIGTAIPFNQNVGNLVAPLNPLQMSSICQLWYDFTDLSSLTLNGSNIEVVSNKGQGINSDCRQATISKQPVSTFQEGQYTARFDLRQQQQLVSAQKFSVQANGTFVIIAKLTDEGSQQVYGMATMRNPNVNSMRLINNGANTTITQFTSGINATDSQASSPLATNLHYSLYDINDNSNTLTAYFNGIAGASSNMTGVPITTSANFYIGSSNSTAQYFNGDIFEIFYFPVSLTDTLLGEIKSYIETKYAIPQS